MGVKSLDNVTIALTDAVTKLANLSTETIMQEVKKSFTGREARKHLAASRE